MNDTRLTTVAGRYSALRGLFLLPGGLLLVAAGLFNMPPMGAEPVNDGAGYFLGAMAIAAAGYVAVNHYYVTRFGRVDPATRTKVRVVVSTAIEALAIAVGITVDMSRDLPVTAFGALFAVAMLWHYRFFVGLRTYHWVLLGGLGLLSMVPIWGSVDDKVSLVMIPMGLAVIGLGVLDHRDLVESIRMVRSADSGRRTR